MLGFVVCSFVSDVCGGCDAVGVRVWMGCCWALGGVFFVFVLVISSLMIFSRWVSISPARVYRRYRRDMI